MSKLNQISIYVPLDKQAARPIERLAALADRRNRSVNHLAVQAILEYLDANEPLSASPRSGGRVAEPPTKGAAPPPRRVSSTSSLPRAEAATKPGMPTVELDDRELRRSADAAPHREPQPAQRAPGSGCLVLALCVVAMALLAALLLAPG